MAQGQFLDTFDLPQGATHVAVHQAVNGKMGPIMQAKDGAGNVFSVFELANMSREFIAGTWGGGTYRFAFYSIAGGQQKRIGPRGGAIEIAPPAPVVPAPLTMPAVPKEGMSGMELFTFFMGLQDRASERAERQAQITIERDRAYQTALLTAVRTVSAPGVASGADMKKLVADAVAEALTDADETTEGETMLEKAGVKLMTSIANIVDTAVAEKLKQAGNG